jgi:hypothetical protein
MEVTLGRLARSLGFASAAFGIALATSAGAADNLTGSYEGKLTCKGLVAGAAAKTKQDVTIAVSESKIGVALKITAGATEIGDALRAFVMDDAGKPDRAKVFGVDCDMDLVSLSNLTLIADAVAKEGSDKATLKGALTDTTGKTQILDCTFSAKRTSTAPPKFEGCILE